MRPCGLVRVAAGLVLALGVSILRGDSGNQAQADKVAGLVKQLGDENFARREAASKELAAIGEPALAALRKAAASSDDLEIRRRAEQVVREVTGRVLAVAARKELTKWKGSWAADPGVTMTITGERFASSAPTIGPRNGKLIVIEVREKVALVDFFVDEGDVKGQTAKAILRLEGDTLHYCVTYSEARPTDFKTAAGNYYIAWKRVAR